MEGISIVRTHFKHNFTMLKKQKIEILFVLIHLEWRKKWKIDCLKIFGMEERLLKHNTKKTKKCPNICRMEE